MIVLLLEDKNNQQYEGLVDEWQKKNNKATFFFFFHLVLYIYIYIYMLVEHTEAKKRTRKKDINMPKNMR
jgi:hypothetical protein